VKGNEMEEAKSGVVFPAALADARRRGQNANRYVVPTEERRSRMTQLVAALLGESLERAAVDLAAADLEFRVEAVPELPDAVLLRELTSERAGGGAYLFRLRSRSTLIVQAPHTFFDSGTLPLSYALFERAKARALFIDTAHRYRAAEANEDGDYPADVAHAKDSLFQAATEGALRALPNSTVVQLHGFAARESQARAILSTGRGAHGDPWLENVRRLLMPLIGPAVLRFPDESAELGGTTNVQGTLVRSVGGRFLHVEMSAELRSTLLADTELRARAFDALVAGVELP
jgi:hypothetical protein